MSGALLGSSPRARRLANRHYRPLVCAGWFGVLLVLLGAVVLPHPQSLLALAIGGPLSGLSFWSRREGGEDDGGGGGEDGGDDSGPPPPDGEWERIVEEFERQLDGDSSLSNAPPSRRRRRRERTPGPVSPAKV